MRQPNSRSAPSPGDNVILRVAYGITLTALWRTAGIFQVDYYGELGWNRRNH